MGNLAFHPAPGTANGGKLPAGFLSIQNTEAANAAYGITRSRGIAEIIPAYYAVPQNPVMDYVKGQAARLGQGKGVSGCGGSTGGCGCGGKCGGSLNGITEDWDKIQTDMGAGDWGAILQDTVFGIPLWAGVATIAFMMLADTGGGSMYARSRRAGRAAAKAY